MLARCTHLVSNAGGAPAPLSDASRRRVLQQVEQLGASRALRCLALAAKTVAAQHRQVNQSVLQQPVPQLISHQAAALTVKTLLPAACSVLYYIKTHWLRSIAASWHTNTSDQTISRAQQLQLRQNQLSANLLQAQLACCSGRP